MPGGGEGLYDALCLDRAKGNVFGKIILMILFGFFLARRHILTEGMKKNLTSLLMKVVLPVSIISSAGQDLFTDLAVFANVGFIGFPLMGGMLGNVGTLYTVAYNMAYQLFFFSYGLLILKKNGKLSLKGLFNNGII